MENMKLRTQPGFVNVSNLTPATAAAVASSSATSKDSTGSVASAAQTATAASDSTNSAVTGNVVALGTAPFAGNVTDAAAKINAIKGGDTEIVLYQKITIGTGSRAGNAWLQEASDPISKATWDNYAMVSPELGKKLFGIDIFNPHDSDKYEVHPDKPVIKITSNGKTTELPI